MAVSTPDLTLMADGAGHSIYYYQSDTDTRATVAASGYFNNTDDNLNLAVDDVILVGGDEGYYWLRVDTVTAGVVATAAADGGTWVSNELLDISTASVTWVVSPCDGIIGRMYTVLHGTISGADAVVGLEIGGTDVTGCQVTIANSGSAAGDVDAGAATAARAVAEGGAIEITTDGASTGTIKVTAFVEILPA